MTSKPGPLDPVVAALKLRRRRLGLTGYQLAHRAGLSPTTVYHLESGRLSSNLYSIRAIADALDCEIYVVPRQLGQQDGAA